MNSMNNKSKLILPILTALVLAGTVTSVVTIASAASTPSSSSGQAASTITATASTSGTHPQMTPPAAMGKVTAISGNMITITDQKPGSTTSMTYTVDATNATVTKDRDTASSVSAIAIGDMIAVDGTVSGSNVTATTIHDGFGGPGGFGGGRGGPGGGAMGTVTAVSGTTLTVTDKDGGVYTIDASSATVKADGSASAVSDIKVGDTVMIQGKVTTASMTATDIEDGIPTPPSSTTTTSGTSTQ